MIRRDGVYSTAAVSDATARRLVRAYGTRIERILGTATDYEQLGPRFAGDLTGAEVRYLMAQEWALTPEDVLWRRTKLGLVADKQDHAALDDFMASKAEA